MTIQEILKANRESVISSIKFVFKVWKQEDIKVKMIELLDFANANYSDSVDSFLKSTKIKTELKYIVQRLAISQIPVKDNRSVTEMRADWMDANNLEFDIRTKKYYSVK